MNTETDYMNGGPTVRLLKMALKSGVKLSAEEHLTIAAHDAMPRNKWYTHSQLQAKRKEIEDMANNLMPEWKSDAYLDLYGVPTGSDRPARMSTYDKTHTTRTTF